MLEGWYCRTLNEQAAQSQPNDDDSSDDDSQIDGQPAYNSQNVDYKSQYRYLKQKLKYLIYENESFQDALRSSQRRLLKVSRDRSFLLDRLLQYEKPSDSETDETESSGDEVVKNETVKTEPKKRKLADGGVASNNTNPTVTTGATRGRKRKNFQQPAKIPSKVQQNHNLNANNFQQINSSGLGEGHMTTEEVERHLQSRQFMELPERAPPTVPNEMFSNEPSLDSESNDHMIETSPSNIGEDCLTETIVKTEYQLN